MYAPEAIIRLERVTKYFGRLRALNEVSLAVQAGEKIVVMGPSGAGKTTVLRTINRLERVDSGRVVVGGLDIADREQDIHRIRMDVGMIFPDFSLFPHRSVLQNVTLAPVKLRGIPQEEAEAIGLRLLEKVDMRSQARLYPAQLGGGQKQRVAIARVLAMNPRIILFDEPTSALDPMMTKEVLDVMVNLAGEGMTMVVVTHEVNFAHKVADRIVFMDHGEILEMGHPSTVLDNPCHPRAEEFLGWVR